MAGTYRSRGKIHQSRTGKTKVKGQKTWGKPSKKKLVKAAKTISEGGLNTPEDTLGTAHSQAIETGNRLRAVAQASQPGKAQEIIKRRRV